MPINQPGGTIAFAYWVLSLVLNVTVTSGDQQVACPPVTWQAAELWVTWNGVLLIGGTDTVFTKPTVSLPPPQ